MILQLAKTVDEDKTIVIILRKGKKALRQYLFVKPLSDLNVKDEIAIDNGSIQMALWTMAQDELQVIKGATFDTSALPRLQQDKLAEFLK